MVDFDKKMKINKAPGDGLRTRWAFHIWPKLRLLAPDGSYFTLHEFDSEKNSRDFNPLRPEALIFKEYKVSVEKMDRLLKKPDVIPETWKSIALQNFITTKDGERAYFPVLDGRCDSRSPGLVSSLPSSTFLKTANSWHLYAFELYDDQLTCLRRMAQLAMFLEDEERRLLVDRHWLISSFVIGFGSLRITSKFKKRY